MLKDSRQFSLGIWTLGFGYFIFYTPYSALTKAISNGLLSADAKPVPGAVILPVCGHGYCSDDVRHHHSGEMVAVRGPARILRPERSFSQPLDVSLRAVHCGHHRHHYARVFLSRDFDSLCARAIARRHSDHRADC